MSERKKDNFLGNPNESEEKPNLTLFYIAIGCFAVGAVLFAISFFVKGAGVYLIIASMISELASVSFLNGQKRRGETTACKVLKVLSYIVMGAAILVFIVGAALSRTAQ